MPRTPLVVLALAGIALVTLTLPLSGSSGASAFDRTLEPRDLNQIEFDVRKVRQNLADLERRFQQPIDVVIKEPSRTDPGMTSLSTKLDAIATTLQRIERSLDAQRASPVLSPTSADARLERARAERRSAVALRPRTNKPASLEGEGRIVLHSVLCEGGVANLYAGAGTFVAPVSSLVYHNQSEFSSTAQYAGVQQFDLGITVELPLVARSAGGQPNLTLIYSVVP